MFTPELKEFDDYRSGFSPEDRQFLEKVQFKLYDQPLRSKIGERVLEICSVSRFSKGLLVSTLGTISAGLISGSIEIFAVGIGLSSLWQTTDWVSHWRKYLAIEA